MRVTPSDKQKGVIDTNEAVKAEARLHFARWLATGQEYHLRLLALSSTRSGKGQHEHLRHGSRLAEQQGVARQVADTSGHRGLR